MSVTVPKAGTRGSRFPRFPGWVARFFSRLQQRMFRRNRGGRTQGGVPTLMLETIGARSGDVRSAMLGFVEDGPGAWLVVASLAGSARNPAWLYNLARNPVGTVELADGRRHRVEAITLKGPELDAAWERLAREAPEYPRYLSVTDRSISIVRLRELPVDAPPAAGDR